jgi:AbrB family looped-hinge helix DNA binding protein
MPLVKVKQKFQVVIPEAIREEIQLEVGDLLDVSVKGREIVLRPKAVVDRSELDRLLDDRLEQLRRGKVVGPFANVEEFKASLKKP